MKARSTLLFFPSHVAVLGVEPSEVTEQHLHVVLRRDGGNSTPPPSVLLLQKNITEPTQSPMLQKNKSVNVGRSGHGYNTMWFGPGAAVF